MEAKTVLKIAVIFGAFIALLFSSNHASAAVTDYDWNYNVTNLYNSYALIYQFDNLDATTDYSWQIQFLNEDGSVKAIVDTEVVDPGSTAGSWVINSAIWTQIQSHTTFTLEGPFRVVDNFSQVLGYHYLLPAPSDDWINGGGQNDADDKIGFVGAAYNDLNAESGFQHDPNTPEIVTVTRGNDTFIHYQFDSASLPTTDIIEIYNIETGDLVQTFQLSEFVDYNCDQLTGIGAPFSCATDLQTKNFVRLSTDGTTPTNIKIAQSDAAFVTADENPHETTFDYGAYEYRKSDSLSNWIADGESVFLISRSKLTDDNGVEEWHFDTLSNVVAGGTQRLTLYQATTEIHSAYPNQLIEDGEIGLVSDDALSYQSRYTLSYDVTGESNLVIPVYWNWEANALTASVASTAAYKFQLIDQYGTVDVKTSEERVNESLVVAGLNSPLGRIVLYVIAQIVMLYFVSTRLHRPNETTPFIAKVFVFSLVGVFLALIHQTNTITNIITGIGILALVMQVMDSARRNPTDASQ